MKRAMSDMIPSMYISILQQYSIIIDVLLSHYDINRTLYINCIVEFVDAMGEI